MRVISLTRLVTLRHFMNHAQRRRYSQQYLTRFNRWEAQYRASIKRALQWQINQFIEVLKRRGKGAAFREMEGVLFNEEMANVLRRLYVEVGITTGNLTLREINTSAANLKARGFGFNEQWRAAILQYFRDYLLDAAVVPITDTTKEQIRQLMEEAEQEGWSIEQIVYRLQQSDITQARARLIARTELNKATFYGRKLGEDESEWETTKEWIAANDHRTRDSHRLIDGAVLDEEQNFQVRMPSGGTEPMEGPGDPQASAANVCNCRCTLATVVKVDARGRPIPKTKSSVVIIRPDQIRRPTRLITI